MNTYIVINKKNKKIASIKYPTNWNFYLNKLGKKPASLSGSLKQYLERFINFKINQSLKKILDYEIFGYKQNNVILTYKFDINLIVKLVAKTLIKCNTVLDANRPINVFILPTYNNFVSKKMFGVNGLTYRNTIFLFISRHGDWNERLPKIIAHEYAHLLSLSANKLKTLLDYLIFEGIAENFQKKVLNGKNMPWTKAINVHDARLILKEISPHIYSTNQQYYHRIFLGWDKKYPLWSGYAIGYYVVKSFILKNSNRKWTELIKMKPDEIYKKSIFSMNFK